jgi:hypothetical protein
MLERPPGRSIPRNASRPFSEAESEKMACKACKSENVRQVDGELTASLPEIKDVRVPPVSVRQPISVCLDCGFAELVFPAHELDLLKRSKLK